LQALASSPFAVWRLRRRAERAVDANAGRKCTCGYELMGLSIPRCPECGRAIGFDKSFEELGLTDAELARINDARHQRQQAQQSEPKR
jgi:hypothetical protein